MPRPARDRIRSRICSRSRAGMAIFLVLLIVLLIAAFTSIWIFVLRNESEGTDEFSKKLIATSTGAGAAAILSATVNRWPWNERFYRKIGSEDPPGSDRYAYFFSEASFPFQGTYDGLLDRLGRSTWTNRDAVRIEGVIVDLVEPRSYRVKMKISFSGVYVFMTWDKTWSQDFLGSLTAANDVVVTRSAPVGSGEVDQVIDQIKLEARSNMDPDGALITQIDGVIKQVESGVKPDIVLVP